MEIAFAIFFVGILIFLAHLFAGLFSQTKIPDVLLLILIGLCLGPGLGLVTAAHFGAVGGVFATITLVILLFEEGTGLSLEILWKAMRGTSSLTLVNFLVSTVAVGLVALFLTDLGPVLSFMLGAIVGSTSPAVVVPLVRQLKMQEQSRTILVLESAVSDVLSIVVALAILEFHKLGELRFGLMLGHIIASFSLAAALGIGSGFLWSILLQRVRTLQNAIFTTPAFVFVVFGIAEIIGFSGYIAALAFGVTLGNIGSLKLSPWKRHVLHEPITFNQTEKVFFSEVAFLLKTFFFVYVGLSVQLTDLWVISLGFLLTLLIFLIRIPVVRFSVQKSTPISDASLMAAMTPKGLAAVVLASIPLQHGIEGGDLIQNVSYAVVMFSIIMTSVLIFLLERTELSNLYGRIFSGFAGPQDAPARVQE